MLTPPLTSVGYLRSFAKHQLLQRTTSRLLLIADNLRTSYHYGSRFVNTPCVTIALDIIPMIGAKHNNPILDTAVPVVYRGDRKV
jgi:hypothetical protein